MKILEHLEPKEVFSYFEEICSIPHGSSDTKKISDYLVDFAIKHQLHYIQDTSNNVIIFKSGTKGYENSAPVMIQGHMDMVCEKEPDCDIDFSSDGLRLKLSDGIISARGTTLGGDDGIAIAYALAILAASDIHHPPLEAVFTVDEEIGMLGAAALDCSPLKSRIMLNLDSEEEGHLLVSCAGGVTVTAHLPLCFQETTGYSATITIDGLQGGHSGVEIDKGRANACMLLGRALFHLQKLTDFRMVSIHGGLKDNAIPRQATAVLVFLSNNDLETATELLSSLQSTLHQEYALTDAGIKIDMTTTSTSTHQTMDKTTTQNVITALYNLPNGIQKMSYDIEGLVQTSLNLGILKTEKTEVTFSFSARSSIESEKTEMTDRITCLLQALGGAVTTAGDYPAWEYRKDSPLRELMIDIYKKQYGKTPEIEALHAGVECGLFAGKLPGLDCVSFGPDMKDIHTPKESMNVESVRRTWNYLLDILKALK